MKRTGYIFMDTLIGLILIAGSAALLAAVSARMQRATTHLDDIRQADRLANEAMLSLQVDPNPQPIEGAEITVEKLSDLKAPGGWEWVVVHCKTSRAQTQITGLIRGAS